MADNHELVKCPLCEGRGEVRLREALQLLRDQTLENQINRGLSGNGPSENPQAESETKPELELATSTLPEPRNFQQDVHGWNPQLPMWRRSPKE
jgi:hypothetical protein